MRPTTALAIDFKRQAKATKVIISDDHDELCREEKKAAGTIVKKLYNAVASNPESFMRLWKLGGQCGVKLCDVQHSEPHSFTQVW